MIGKRKENVIMISLLRNKTRNDVWKKEHTKRMQFTGNEIGFTLIEMLIVLLVIGTLLLIIVPNLMNAGVDAHEKACEANKQMLTAHIETYYLENGYQYPTMNQLINGNYIDEHPVCPAMPTETNAYTINRSTGAVTCDFHD